MWGMPKSRTTPSPRKIIGPLFKCPWCSDKLWPRAHLRNHVENECLKRPCDACKHPAEFHKFVRINPTISSYFECAVAECACQHFEASRLGPDSLARPTGDRLRWPLSYRITL